MGKVPHGCATTTPATRRLIQQSTEGVQTLAKRLGLTQGTVRKWRRRTSTEEAVRGPKPASTVLTPVEEAAIVLFRQHTLLPLDDCLYALQETLPHLSRSALHRCFQRHGISRLPPADEPAAGAGKALFKAYELGYLHVDFAEVQTEEGKQYLFVAIDRTSKLAFAELQPQATQAIATDFLRRVLPQIPYKVHKLLTDNGIQFRNLPHHTKVGRHPFGQLCDEWGIAQRFTKPAHPWTNGQVERMNRTVKEATIKQFHYETSAQLDSHLQAFLLAYNYAKRLKRLKGLTPHEFICAEWRKNPTIFHRDPTRDPLPHTPVPYS